MRGTFIDNRYAVLDVLGEGGMARVYLAHDNVLDRDVALKFLREQYASDEGFVERFRREAKNAAALNHPSVVQVYDQGRTQEDGTYYMAMEYVPGGTLKERIKKEGPLQPNEAARIASRVAEALEVAHTRGIVHRDIKPQNVLLSASGEAKVADFGIARAASSKTITETNLILGTSAYMSPEQVRGDRVGPASDLYSLGVVLYEMLTGELPYTADDPIATAMKHLDEPPRHPRDANPAVAEELDALVAKLLSKRPEDRYASAVQLAEDLRRVRDGLSPLAVGLGEQRTVQMSQDTGKTRVAPPVVAPGRGSGTSASRGPRQWALVVPLVALLAGMALLSVLTWALGGSTSKQGTPEAGGVQRVEVSSVVGLSRDEAQRRLESAGLKLSQEEASSDEVPEGAVIKQVPAAGTEVERGSVVNVTLSSGPAQEPATRSSPSASPAASPSASPASAEQAEEAAEEAEKAAEERQEEREKALEEAEEEREKALEEAEKEREKAQEEAEK